MPEALALSFFISPLQMEALVPSTIKTLSQERRNEINGVHFAL
jgi:hypothetical protein